MMFEFNIQLRHRLNNTRQMNNELLQPLKPMHHCLRWQLNESFRILIKLSSIPLSQHSELLILCSEIDDVQLLIKSEYFLVKVLALWFHVYKAFNLFEPALCEHYDVARLNFIQ